MDLRRFFYGFTVLGVVVLLLFTLMSALSAFVPSAEASETLEDLNPQLSVKPLFVQLPQDQASGTNSHVVIETIDPSGNPYVVVDESGQGQWSVESFSANGVRIHPSTTNYAGPLQVKVNGRVVNRFSELVPGSDNLVLEKILTIRATDGMRFSVHYTDFSLEKTGDSAYPLKILYYMKKSYELIKREMMLESPKGAPGIIEAYLGDADLEGLHPFGGFTQRDFKRAPLFVIREDEDSGKRIPAILMPVDYSKFLEFWNQINRVPHFSEQDRDQYLASSIMHEMTHAVVHGINENLGSTEHEIHNGDWFTEGLARYFETKIGSDVGFASMGFRRRNGDKIQFSRGGANYFLRYPDESFFTLRYENALFWLYFEQRFGRTMLRDLSTALGKIPFASEEETYMRAIEKTTHEPFDVMLDKFFNWIYQEQYKTAPQSRHLLPVARSKTIWSKGNFYTYSKKGALLHKSTRLQSDWVAHWDDFESSSLEEYTAGDWTNEADIKPLAFDVQEILLSRGTDQPVMIRLANTRSSNLRATFYLETESGIKTESYQLVRGGAAEVYFPSTQSLSKVAIVIANLDPHNSTRYDIEVV